MSRLRIPIGKPYSRSHVARRRAMYRWASAILAALIAVLCLVALPAIAAAIHYGI